MLPSSVLVARLLLVAFPIGLAACSGNAALPASASDAAGRASEPLCSATPTQLLDFDALAHDLGAGPNPEVSTLAVVGGSIYFVFDTAPNGGAPSDNGGWLLSLPVGGGAYTTLLQGVRVLSVIGDPVATSTALVLHYFTNNFTNNEEILAVSPAWPAPRMLATSNDPVRGITADDSSVYFVDHDGLKSVPLAGGSAQLLSDAFSNLTASGLAVVGSSVVATTNDQAGGPGALYKVPIGGGSPTMFPTGQAANFFPLACGSDVCWSMGPDLGKSPGFIARLSGGTVSTISAPTVPSSLSFDGTSFYATVGDDTLVRIPASGGPVVTMGTAYSAAVAGDCVYFWFSEPVGLPSNDGGASASGIYSVRKM